MKREDKHYADISQEIKISFYYLHVTIVKDAFSLSHFFRIVKFSLEKSDQIPDKPKSLVHLHKICRHQKDN